MCNRYRLTAKQADVAATFGIRPPYEPDETFPVGDIFPTGTKTPFYGSVIVQDGTDRRLVRMERGVPTQVPGKRDPSVKLTKYVTNVRNLSSTFWRSMLTTPTRRCLVPVTSFSEYGIAPGEDGKKPFHWFRRTKSADLRICRDLAADRAGQCLWLPHDRAKRGGGSNPSQAMPVILHDDDYDRWLTAHWDTTKEMVAPYPSQLMRVS